MKVIGGIGRGIAHVLTLAARVLGGMGNGAAGGTGGARSVDPETYRTLMPPPSRRDDYRP